MIEEKINAAKENDESVSNITIDNELLEKYDCSKTDFENVIFIKSRFSGCNFTGAGFYGVTFENCDFSNCRFENAYFKDTKAIFCKGDGSVFKESVFRDFSASSSSFCYADFAESLWDSCKINECEMREAFMSECKLKKTTFSNVNFTRTDFFGTMLKGLDFSDCIIDGIMVSEHFNELNGLKLNVMQAADIAKLLGIKII